MAKKIEGYVDGTGEGPEFTPYKEGNQYFPFWQAQGITLKPKFDYWRKAVVVVTHERVFTESEVWAYGNDLLTAHLSPGEVVDRLDDEPLYRWISRAVKSVNEKHGISDPA